MFTSFDSFISESSIWLRKFWSIFRSSLQPWDLRFFRGDLRVFDFFGNTHREAQWSRALPWIKFSINFLKEKIFITKPCVCVYIPWNFENQSCTALQTQGSSRTTLIRQEFSYDATRTNTRWACCLVPASTWSSLSVSAQSSYIIHNPSSFLFCVSNHGMSVMLLNFSFFFSF